MTHAPFYSFMGPDRYHVAADVAAAGSDADSAPLLVLGSSRITSVPWLSGVRFPEARPQRRMLIVRVDGGEADLALYPAEGDGFAEGFGSVGHMAGGFVSNAATFFSLGGLWHLVSSISLTINGIVASDNISFA